MADPITLEGTITVNHFSSAGARADDFRLTGTNFSADIRSVTGASGLVSCTPSLELPPCERVDPTWSATGTSFVGSFTIDGASYSTNVFNSLDLAFATDAFEVATEHRERRTLHIEAPFHFQGQAFVTGKEIRVALTGEGTVRIHLRRQTSGEHTGLYVERAIYTFGRVVDGVKFHPDAERHGETP